MKYFSPGSEWFWASFNCVLVLITICVIWRQLRLQGYSHVIQSMFVFDEKWRSQEMTIARREVCANYSPTSTDLNRPEDFVARFFEDLANYVLQGALPLRFVWTTYSYEVDHYWPMLQPAILRLREETGDPTLFVHFERLHRRSRRYGYWKNRWSFAPLPVDIKRFLKTETQNIAYYSDLRQQNLIIMPP